MGIYANNNHNYFPSNILYIYWVACLVWGCLLNLARLCYYNIQVNFNFFTCKFIVNLHYWPIYCSIFTVKFHKQGTGGKWWFWSKNLNLDTTCCTEVAKLSSCIAHSLYFPSVQEILFSCGKFRSGNACYGNSYGVHLSCFDKHVWMLLILVLRLIFISFCECCCNRLLLFDS